MKTLSAAITVISLALSGCAHTGYYQQGYSDYGYGGYTTETYYGSPSQSYYYQPGSVYTYDRYYVPSHPSHHHDHDRDQYGDRDRHETWVHEGPRHSRQQSDAQRHEQHPWNAEMPHQRQENFDRATEHAQRRQTESFGQRPFGGEQPARQQHSRQFSDSTPSAEHRRHRGDDTGDGNEGRGRRR